MLFRLSSPVLVLVVSIVIIGSTVLGYLLGRALDRRREGLREPLGVTQGALVGVRSRCCSLSASRWRWGDTSPGAAAVVTEANAIGTTYLRAQTLTEPVRSESLALIKEYTNLRIRLDHEVPGSKQFDETSDESQRIQNQLWGLAGNALNASPVDSAPRLYVETLNDMIDAHTTRVSALDNRIPTSVWLLQIVATAVALAILAMYVAMLGRGVLTVFLAAALITIVVLVMFDLDRPSRGFIRVPATPLVVLRDSMDQPAAAVAPAS